MHGGREGSQINVITPPWSVSTYVGTPYVVPVGEGHGGGDMFEGLKNPERSAWEPCTAGSGTIAAGWSDERR